MTERPPSPTGAPAGPGYAEALAELDEILAELESGHADVDRLAERVARGTWLVDHCRQRLGRVRDDVETELAGPAPGTPSGTDRPVGDPVEPAT